MKLYTVISLVALVSFGVCDKTNRQPLTYAPIPNGTYVPTKNSSVTTLLDFVNSRDDLTILAGVLKECAGMNYLNPQRKESKSLVKGFSKLSILRHHGHIHFSPPQTRLSTTQEPTTRLLLQLQKVNGGWVI